MAVNEQMTRGGPYQPLAANNGQPVPSTGPAPVDAPSSRAGDSWYHEDAIVLEKAVREREPH